MFFTIFFLFGAAMSLTMAVLFGVEGHHAKSLDAVIWFAAFTSSTLLKLWGIS